MKFRKALITALLALTAATSSLALASCSALEKIPGVGGLLEKIPGLGHKHELTLVEGVDATCEAAGKKDYYTCGGCDKLFADAEGKKEITAPEVVNALGHDWDNGEVTTQPTCEGKGVKTFTCQNDANHTYTEEVDVLGHDWDNGEITTQPTCEGKGVKTFTCQNDANHTYTEEVDALGHDWDDGEVTTDPTCLGKGVKTFTCKHDANHTYTEEVAALGHDTVKDEAKAPTCTETGLSEGSHCSRCDGATVTQTVVPATGHSYDDDRDESCNSCGFVRDVACEHTNTETLPAVGATCTATGLTEGLKCKDCDTVIVPQESVPVIDHKAGEAVAENEVKSTCAVAGSYESVVYCSACGYEMSRETKALELAAHSYTYSVEGTLVYLAADGSYDNSAVVVTATCSVCEGSEAVSEYSVDVANVFVDGASISVGETTLPVSVSLKYVGTEDVKEFTLGTSEVKFAGIVIENAKLTVNGNVTVNGGVVGSDGFFVVDNGATVNVATVKMTGALVANADAEYDYDYRLFVREGTLNLSVGIRDTRSIQVGSEKDKAKGYLNINTVEDAIGGYSATCDARFMFANGEVNIIGVEGGDKTAIALNKTGSRWIDVNAGMKLFIKDFSIGIGTWSKNRYFGIHQGNFTYENVTTIIQGHTSGTYVYPFLDTQMMYEDPETGITALANVTLKVDRVSANGAHTDLEFIPVVTTENYTECKFRSWVECACTESGHDWDEGEITKTPTCTEAGEKLHVCNVDGSHTWKEVLSAAHNIVVDAAKAPTCTETGLTEGSHCTNCEEATVPQEEVEATGHSYDDDNDASCNNCGYVRDIACQHAEVETLPAVDATCLETGLTEGKKCLVCEDVFVPQEEVPAKGHSFVYSVEDALVYAVADESCAVVVTATCSACEHSEEVSDYTVNTENVMLGNASVSVGETTLPVNVSLKYVGLESTLSEGTFAGITAENATLTVDGNVTVNGDVTTTASWVTVAENANVTVNGVVKVAGGFETNEEYETGFRYRLTVEGTLNVNSDNKTALWLNSIRVGSDANGIKGYLNVSSGTGNGIELDANIASRFMFACGEVNFVGSVAGGTGSQAAMSLGGNGVAKYIDIFASMKFKVKNHQAAIANLYAYHYIGVAKDSMVLEDTSYAFRGDSTSSKCKTTIYPTAIVQVEWTDEETGVTGLANVELKGGKTVSFNKASHADCSFIPFGTAEEYTAGTWTGNAKFLSWVEAA